MIETKTTKGAATMKTTEKAVTEARARAEKTHGANIYLRFVVTGHRGGKAYPCEYSERDASVGYRLCQSQGMTNITVDPVISFK